MIEIDELFEYEYDIEDLLTDSKTCYVCKTVKFRKIRGMCANCSPMFTISRSQAKTQYNLLDSDLSDLYSYDIKTQWGHGKMYMLLEVRNRAIEKHFRLIPVTKEEYGHFLNLFLDEKSKKAERRREAVERKQTSREQTLSDALAKHKLKIRSDSYLCKSYVDGSIKDLDHVVTQMVVLDFLFKNCQYGLECKIAITKLHKDLHEDCSDGIYYDREEVKEIIEETKEKLKKKLIKKYIKENGRKSVPKIIKRHYNI